MIGGRQDFFGRDFEEMLTTEMQVLSRMGEKYGKICRNGFLACFLPVWQKVLTDGCTMLIILVGKRRRIFILI